MLVKQGNTTKYGGEWLKVLAANANAEPDSRVVEIIVLTHQTAIERRYDRIAEQRQFVLLNDDLKASKKYEKALNDMKQESSNFVVTFDMEEEDFPPSTLPAFEAMDRLTASCSLALEQMKADKRIHAIGVALMAHQVMQLYAVGLQSYNLSRLSSSKVLAEKGQIERERLKAAHVKMQRCLGNYLAPLLPKVSKIVQFMMTLIQAGT